MKDMTDKKMSPIVTTTTGGILLASLTKLLGALPFFVNEENGKPSFNWTRLIEALIIGLVAGYISFIKMSVEVENMKADLTEMKTRIDKIYTDIYRPSISNTPERK